MDPVSAVIAALAGLGGALAGAWGSNRQLVRDLAEARADGASFDRRLRKLEGARGAERAEEQREVDRDVATAVGKMVMSSGALPAARGGAVAGGRAPASRAEIMAEARRLGVVKE